MIVSSFPKQYARVMTQNILKNSPFKMFFIICLFSSFSQGVEGLGSNLVFADSKLEKAIARNIGVEVNELSSTVIRERLRFFELNDANIKDLRGIEHAANLETLILRNNLINDVSPIASLPKLRKLDLSGNSIGNLGSFLNDDETRNLEEINRIKKDLLSNRLSDIQKRDLVLRLTSLERSRYSISKSLTDLNLSRNRMLGLSGIENFTKLRTLNVSYNSLLDLDGINSLQNLANLYLQGNQLGIQESYEDLNKNKSYDTGEPFKDLSGNGKWEGNALDSLKTMRSLTNLYLFDNHLASLRSFEDLPSLQVLLLSGNKLKDLSGLENCRRLRKLHLNNNYITNLSVLGELPNLTDLQLSENRICDIRTLAKLGQLKELHLQFNHIRNVESLKFLNKLQRLSLSGNLIESFSFLAALENLYTLNISNNFLASKPNMDRLESLSNSRNKEVFYSNQSKPIDSLTKLGMTLASNEVFNRNLNDFLGQRGFDRFSEFIASKSYTETQKDILYSKWNELLIKEIDLENSGFEGIQ